MYRDEPLHNATDPAAGLQRFRDWTQHSGKIVDRGAGVGAEYIMMYKDRPHNTVLTQRIGEAGQAAIFVPHPFHRFLHIPAEKNFGRNIPNSQEE